MELSKGLPIDNWTKFANTQAGRDKIYRFIQYASRFLAARLPADQAIKYTKLMTAMALGRRLFRAGKPIEDINAFLKALAIQDPFIRLLTCARHLLLAGWLSVDTVQWLQAVGFLQIADPKVLDKKAAQFWFLSLVMGTILNLYKLQKNNKQILALKKDDTEKSKQDLKKLYGDKKAIQIDTVRDGLDLILPGSALEIIQVETGVVGIVGSITSLIMAYQIWGK